MICNMRSVATDGLVLKLVTVCLFVGLCAWGGVHGAGNCMFVCMCWGRGVCTLGLERIHQVTNTIRIAIQGGEYDTYREYTFSQRLN